MIKTFKNIANFKNLKKNQKWSIIFLFLFTSPMVWLFLSDWKGTDMPPEPKIQYSEGMLDYGRDRQGRTTLILRTLGRLSEVTYYDCSNSRTVTNSSCMQEKKLKPYVGQTAKIGWYTNQDPSGAFANTSRQLVSLEVEGEALKTYTEAKNRVRTSNRFSIGMALLFIVCSTYLFEWLYYPKDD